MPPDELRQRLDAAVDKALAGETPDYSRFGRGSWDVMGLRRTLNIDLTLTHELRKQFGVETRVLMRKGGGESWAHVLMKFASYAMFYHPELHIEHLYMSVDGASVDSKITCRGAER